MGIHDLHRDRTLKKFSKMGFDNLEEHEILEIILFFSVPRVDTNPIAHELLNKYHTIAEVMDAPAEELKKFDYITDRTVQLFKMIKLTSAHYQLEKQGVKAYLTTTEECADYFTLLFAASNTEKIGVLYLNSRGKFLGGEIICEGNLHEVNFPLRNVVTKAINKKATEIVICHNHPASFPVPSEPDVKATQKIKITLEAMGLFLTDHIILGDGDYTSMRSIKQYEYLFKSELQE